METIIFYVTDKKNGVKAVQDLVDDIKANKDAEHMMIKEIDILLANMKLYLYHKHV